MLLGFEGSELDGAGGFEVTEDVELDDGAEDVVLKARVGIGMIEDGPKSFHPSPNS